MDYLTTRLCDIHIFTISRQMSMRVSLRAETESDKQHSDICRRSDCPGMVTAT